MSNLQYIMLSKQLRKRRKEAILEDRLHATRSCMIDILTWFSENVSCQANITSVVSGVTHRQDF